MILSYAAWGYDESMRAAVIYTSKHGTMYSIANHIAKALNFEIYSLDEFDSNTLPNYDTIILGSPLYNGKIYGGVEQFCRNNLDELLGKKLGLFVSGLRSSDRTKRHQKQAAFLRPLIRHATHIAFVGGAINKEKLSATEKLIARYSLKVNEDTTRIDQLAINELISSMRDKN